MVAQSISRTGRRNGTKSAMHKRCQQATKGVLRRARKAHVGTAGKGANFAVENKRTHKTVVVFAKNAEAALDKVFATGKLAKNRDNLRIAAA